MGADERILGGLAMRRDDALRILAEHRGELSGFSVASLSIFGSVARDEADANSDVDVLVEFSKPVGLFQFAELQQILEVMFGCRVDLVSRNALIPQLRDRILAEAIRAA